jgi:hypothetical protein
MNYGIRLISTYTGEQVAVLGSKYETQKEAYEYFNKNICSRCNSMEIVYIPENYQWVNRHDGFVSVGESA